MAESKASDQLLQIIGRYQNKRPVHQEDRDILSKAVSDIGQDSLIKGLIFSEIFGQPKCKRRGR